MTREQTRIAIGYSLTIVDDARATHHAIAPRVVRPIFTSRTPASAKHRNGGTARRGSTSLASPGGAVL